MIMVQVQNEIYGFSYYDQYGNHQAVSLRRDDQGGLARVNDDGSEEALLELKGISVSDAPIPCENYNNLKNSGAGSILGWNTIFHESFDVMKEYYAGRTSCEDVSEYIRSLCHFSTSSKSQITESLSVIYEHMSRANTRNAVNQNMKEAEKLFSDTGLRKDIGDYYSDHKGIIYYNSTYYFSCESMQSVIKSTIDDIAQRYGVEKPEYDKLENKQTFIDGGITYNGVWNHETFETNHYHTMSDMSFIDNDYSPKDEFIYCEASIRLSEEHSSDGLQSIVKDYVNANLLNTDSGKTHSILMELERNSYNISGHIDKRNIIHRNLAEYGIQINKTPDRLWHSDYFGMLCI